MKKIFIQLLIIVSLFFITYYGLKQINWVEILGVQKITDSTEEKLGDLFWDMFEKTEREMKDSVLTQSIDSIINQICTDNYFDKEYIKLHILEKDEINAFALPNGHLVIYSGLITDSENQEELSGVICHELAHIQLNHVMKKLIKEVGLSVLISMTTGGGNAETIKNTAKMLSSSAFDRKLEKEADLTAVDYMINSKINPEPFADFLYRISEKEHDAVKYLTWISTHPDSKQRSEYILEYCRDKDVNYKSVLTDSTWNMVKEAID